MKKKLIFTILILIVLCVCAVISGYAYNRLLKQDDYNLINTGFYLNGDKVVNLSYGEDYVEEGFTAIIDDKSCAKYVKIQENVDYDHTGIYEIQYTMDYNDIQKTLRRVVIISDTTPPELELNCEDNIYISVGSKFDACKKYMAKDNYDGDINNNVKIDSKVDTSKKGDYKVNYIVADSSDNKIEKSLTVHVREKSEINYVVVYISKQRLDYYENNKIVLTTPVTTGRNNATRTGNFKIRKKARNTTLKGADYESKVKYWMAYDGNNFGLHDASWRRRFGGMDYKWNGSHGCVNLPTSAAEKLYNYVEVGTPVYIKK